MKRFLTYFGWFCLPLLCMPILIYLVDPMGIFREDFRYQVIEPNQRFAKMKWLSEEDRGFDSFIFGSSKVGNIDSRKLNMGRFYNMTYSMGVPHEWMEDTKQLWRAGYDIEHVIICLDEFSYTRTHDMNTSFLRRPYPESSLDRWDFYLKYLLRMPNFPVLQKGFYPLHKDKEFLVEYDIKGSGVAFKWEREAYIDANLDEHVEDWKFDIDWSNKLPRMKESLEAIAELKSFCEDKGIKLLVLFLPVHHKKLKKVKQNRFDQYKERVSEITHYLDFAKETDISKDNRYWFEQIHFRMQVGDMIISRINGDTPLGNFGSRVMQEMVQLTRWRNF